MPTRLNAPHFGELVDTMELGFTYASPAPPYARRLSDETLYVDGGANITAQSPESCWCFVASPPFRLACDNRQPRLPVSPERM
ncbi:hypothetical protein CBM2633_A70099 [Cupriavidus taiwanensis]|nr:hypothetical protein CBM2633_A70099 [Cupriavidus taiwanensis]